MRLGLCIAALVAGLGITASCGKAVKKSKSTTGQAEGTIIEPQGPEQSVTKQDSDARNQSADQNGTQSDGKPSGPGPSNNTPKNEEIPSGYPRVEAGGAISGITKTGEVYFANDETVFFNFSAVILGDKTSVNAHLWFKGAAPTGPLKGQLKSGSCEKGDGAIYSHLAGVQGPTSQIEITFEGSTSPLIASSTVDFVPRDQELSLSVKVSDSLTLCAQWPESATQRSQAAAPETPESSERPVVQAGGSISGFLSDGTVYFAPGDTVFYTAEIEVSAKTTKLSSEVYFKSTSPENDLQGRLMEGSCSDPGAKVYQHLAGNNTLGQSELRVTLSGSDLKKSGSSVALFEPRSVPLSYVITLDPRTSVCLDLNLTGQVKTATTAAGSDENLDPETKENLEGDKVIDGEKSQVLPDGTVVFGPNQVSFFTVQYSSENNKTVVEAAIHFKKGAPLAPIQSQIFKGHCNDLNAQPYQHIAGDSTPGKSEVRIPLEGSKGDITLSGRSNAEFVFKDVPLSYVIHLSGQRLCADFVKN